MNTLRAMALIERAVELHEARFTGDALEEACRCASVEERQAVWCIVRSRPALFGQPATPEQVIAALREMVRGEAVQAAVLQAGAPGAGAPRLPVPAVWPDGA